MGFPALRPDVTSKTGGATVARRARHGTRANGVWRIGLQGGRGGFQDTSRNVLKELDGMVGGWGVSKIEKQGLTIAPEF